MGGSLQRFFEEDAGASYEAWIKDPHHVVVGGNEISAGTGKTDTNYFFYDGSADGIVGSVPTGMINILSEMANASTYVGGSVYENAVAYNPDLDLANAQSLVDQALAAIIAMDAAGRLESALKEAAAIVDANTTASDSIDDMVQAKENEDRPAFLAEQSAIAAAYFMANAVQTTAFVQDMMNSDIAFSQAVASFEERLRLSDDDARKQGILSLLRAIVSVNDAKLAGYRNAANLGTAQAQFAITAKQDQVARDLMYEEKDAKWNLSLFEHYAKVLSSARGGATIPGESKAERFLNVAGAFLNQNTSLLAGVFGRTGVGVSSGLSTIASFMK